jgi:uncharacterized protein (TIGR02246 family)
MSEQDVRTGEQQWLKAFNGGDASGVANFYAEKARLMPPNVDILEGRPSIEAFVKEFLQTGAKLSFELLTVHDAGDVCVSVGRYEMTFPADAPGDSGKFIEVWKRQSDGAWRIVDDIFNSSLPAPTA